MTSTGQFSDTIYICYPVAKMFKLVSLLIAAALVSLQSAYIVSAQIDNPKNDLDNNIQINPVPQRRRLRNFIKMSQAPPQRVRYEPGAGLQLVCEVTGSPAPQVQWLKNGEPMLDYEEETNEIPTVANNIARLVSKLVLSAARAGDVFTCDANNGLKEITASTTVYTESELSPQLLSLENLFPAPSKPVISLHYEDIIQESGTSLLLPCRVSGAGEHQIVWQDNNNQVVYGSPRLQVLPSGDLLIVELQWGDMGQWSCTARSSQGKDTAGTFVYPSKPRKQVT
ncbi:neural/ectodermal development factor IMP-L2 isoform X1 [Papilio machaon]|uniref:neural/ectodermal development factor IMP-L2 isoform X1 n=3 Tax=Papilio machaon TaxID=76193 RepID=UPI001E663468|nr:neural/ectodermal development factor IMP-L2 isoform X1 [Papilio machaon]